MFALWTANGNPVSKNVTVSNGQAVLNINLPKASEVSYYNWKCQAGYYDGSGVLQAYSNFTVKIKKIHKTTILASNILGKMGKKVDLVAYVYDDDGYRVTAGTVTFTVNGKSYKKKKKNGKALKTITSPFVGIYKVKVKVKAAGNSNYRASASKTLTFRIKIK